MRIAVKFDWYLAVNKGDDMEPSEAPLPISYARYPIRVCGSGMSLHCSGQTGGSYGGQPGGLLGTIQDGDGLDTVIRMADEHRPLCEWAIYPNGEREHPELTVQRRVMVHLKWATGPEAEQNFAVLNRLDSNVWNAWLQRSPTDAPSAAWFPAQVSRPRYHGPAGGRPSSAAGWRSSALDAPAMPKRA